ncbi:MAG: glycine oxidase ThiO [Porticoccaceae bacterium]|nr:glycine oxidase ThiO [Porticoccaceae bacterium]
MRSISPSDHSVAIVGAGLIGRLLALLLTERGHPVTLFDRDPIDSGRAAAWTGAGMLAPWAELESADRGVFELGLRSLALWPALADKLGRQAIDYHDGGSLLVAHRGDQAEYRRCLAQLRARLPAGQRDNLHTLDKAGLQTLEPELSANFNEALWLPGEAWLDGQRLLARLGELLQQRGVEWKPETPVDAVLPHTVRAGTQAFHCDTAMDCRGIGAREAFQDLRAVRGEVLWLEAPEVQLTRPVRLLHPRYRLYLVPRRDNLFVLGATQIESSDSGPLTVRSALELLSAAYSLHPGFAEARVVHSDANLRPALDDNLPRITAESGLIRINGLFRHGFLLAPLVASEALSLVETGHASISA